MKKASIMTTIALLPNLVWSSGNEEAFTPETSSHTPHVVEHTPTPDDDLTHNPSNSSSTSTSNDTASSSEESEDLSQMLRGLNALDLSGPRLQYTSRAEQTTLQYNLCRTIQELQYRIKDLEEAYYKIQTYYQKKILLFQREMNRLSQITSQKNIENRDLISENKRLQQELMIRQSSSSTQDKDTSSDSGADTSSFSDGEDYLGTIKAIKTQEPVFSKRKSRHPSSSAADFGVPPLDLEALIRQREGENY